MFVIPNLKPEEIIIYLRKSRTDDPALSVAETLSKHEQMLDEWCQRNLGELIPERNRFREVVSGETIEARPEIQKVLHLIENPQYKAILIVEPQRLSRGDLEDIGRLTKLLRYTGTVVITLQYSYDLTDERDRDYFERELKRGNEFLEYQKRIMGNGRVLSVENGNYIGSRAPYGYERTRVKEGKRWCHTLTVIPEEAEIVRMIFRLYADGNGATAICTRLNQIGSKTKNGAQWTPPTIYSMLDNPLYIGMVKWQARKTIKVVEKGEVVRHLPRQKEYPLYPGKHEAILDTELWEAVRTRREARAIPRANITSDLKNPLSGLVRCECGRYMIRRPYSGRCTDRLQCQNMTYCGNASCTMDEIVELVKGILRKNIADFSMKISQGADAHRAEHEAYRKQLAEHLASLEEKEVSLWEKYAEGMPKNVFESLLKKNHVEKEQTEKLIRAAEQNAPVQVNYIEKRQLFSRTLAVLEDENASADEQNAMLKRCIKKLTYSRQKGKRGKDAGKNRRGWETQPIQIGVELNI